ncbi:TetR/AcrR family transcriptional regulator [Nocardioides mangrovi]|uniref:TetR/AcrR family transcriptional regulator n=1 Tax=Nocardioides mangrovi TaxID=2874580 RepID=A0ABS7U7X7_9ACTN|nr:TetR/AcrR family transcriptional regulator [Nocardioides mangrovi]MBZ5737089.1 TetR/AcrR family transcriptional regulator [Nocardioides mangrovi]
MTTAPGRPRDRRIDRAVLAATAELLVETGYADLTVAGIAARAGTTKPAIYRRWRSKAHLVHEAAFPVDDRMEVPHTAELADDLRTMVRTVVAVFSDPVARAAVPGLMGEMTTDPTLHAALLERFQAGPIGRVRERLAAAVAAGQARADLDPDAFVEAIGGTTLLALLIRGDGELDDTWIDHTTRLLLEGIAP